MFQDALVYVRSDSMTDPVMEKQEKDASAVHHALAEEDSVNVVEASLEADATNVWNLFGSEVTDTLVQSPIGHAPVVQNRREGISYFNIRRHVWTEDEEQFNQLPESPTHSTQAEPSLPSPPSEIPSSPFLSVTSATGADRCVTPETIIPFILKPEIVQATEAHPELYSNSDWPESGPSSIPFVLPATFDDDEAVVYIPLVRPVVSLPVAEIRIDGNGNATVEYKWEALQ